MVDSGEKKLIGVTAAGGFGKSALVGKFYLSLKGFTHKIWTSFSQAYPFAVWGRWLLDQLKRPAPEKDDDLIIAICHALASERCLLVWDNLETLLKPDGNWVDNGYLEFLLSWFSSHSDSVILVTSREKPSLPANTLNQSKWLSLDGLSTDAGVALLQALEISGNDVDLQQFVKDADGHPLLLKLAAGILHAEEGENPDITALHENIFDILGLHRHDPEASISKILDASIGRLRPELQLFLQRLSIYLLPFDREAARVMWENLSPNDSAIAEQEQDLPTDNVNTVIATQVSVAFPQGNSNPKPLEIVSPKEIEKELRKLAKRCLLQERREERKKERTWIFQFQPLIQDYLQQKISDQEKKIAHQQAITYYEQHRKPQLKSTDELDAVKEYLQIFYHNCEIGQYLSAFNIIQQQTNPDDSYSTCNYWLQLRGYNAIRLDLFELLLKQWRPETDEEVIPFIDTVKTYGDVLQFLKRSEEALNRYQEALEYYRQIGAKLGEANTLIAIGDVLQFLDQREEALNRYQEALEYYRQIGAKLGEANTLKAIGDVLQFLKRSEEALNRYQEALEYYRQIGDRLGEANTLRAIGDVLQFLKRSEEALNRYQEALEYYRQIGDRLGEANT
ncbi:MAG: tetratricopeptide repeat protein, partial [Mastigocoleus sp. MO_167.B18]|nr:tetratricopeptide repeat protein [Mastigocoleus sp. MO_167.B18]